MEKETAMKILKELHDNSLFSNRIALETIIPELADGNDERIRKDIIAYIKKANGEPNNILPSGSYCVLEMITWLEKQGEQKPISDIKYKVSANGSLSIVNGKPFDYEKATITQKDFASVGETATIELSSPIDCGDRIYHVSHKPIGKNGEQKQEWSEEDERMCQETIDWFEKKCFPYAIEYENPARESIQWLKSLKGRVQPKPKEWNDEDDYNLQCMIAKVTYDIQKGNVGRNNELIDWLKSLKERVQPQPKQEWSDEDETMRENIEGALDCYEGMVAEDWEKEKQWLKSLKDRMKGKED